MRGADRGLLDESFGLGRIGQAGVAFLDLDVLLDATEHAELGLDGDALRVGRVNDALGDRHVLLERIVGSIDHHGTVETGLDAIVAGFLVAVVQMHREDGLGEDLIGGANDRLEHLFVRIFTGPFGNLDDERSLGLDAATEESHCLFGVIDVVGADGVFAVSVFEKLSRCDDHRRFRLKGTITLRCSGTAAQAFSAGELNCDRPTRRPNRWKALRSWEPQAGASSARSDAVPAAAPAIVAAPPLAFHSKRIAPG